MKNMLLLCAVLALSSCAHQPPEESLPQSRNQLPAAVTKAPSASEEGSWQKLLQDSLNDMYSDSIRSLQKFHNDTVLDLVNSLEAAKK